MYQTEQPARSTQIELKMLLNLVSYFKETVVSSYFFEDDKKAVVRKIYDTQPLEDSG
jgi:hypothetical protein